MHILYLHILLGLGITLVRFGKYIPLIWVEVLCHLTSYLAMTSLGDASVARLLSSEKCKWNCMVEQVR